MNLSKSVRINIILGTLIFCFGRAAHAQGLTTFGEELRSHHISTTEPELIKALRNPNPEVRAAAAGKLAEDHDLDAVPQLTQAVLSEKDPQTLVNMAAALSWLGSSDAAVALAKVCQSPDVAPLIALDAGRHLASLHDKKQERYDCGKSILMLLRGATDEGVAIRALSVVQPYFSDSLAENDKAEILQAVTLRLADAVPAVRMAAGDALEEIGSKSSISDLQAAIRVEQDFTVRSALEHNLSKLASPRTARP